MIARYASREIAVRYYNGAGYVVREDQHPHTRFTAAGPQTTQGRTLYVGARQGTGAEAGFRTRRYGRYPFRTTHSDNGS